MASRSFVRRLTGALAFLPRRRQWGRGYRDSQAADSWNAQQLEEYVDGHLVRVVRHAARKIPFYRRLYENSGVDIASFGGRRDLDRLPTIDKSSILAAGTEMALPGWPGVLSHTMTTGGSTGTIATIRSIRGFGNIEDGCICAQWRRVGYRRGDRVVRLRGSLLDEGRSLVKLGRGGQRLAVSTYHLRDETVDDILRAIGDFRPQWLHVYPSAAALLATVLRRTDKRLPCQVRGVLCGSENVYPWQIDLFQDAYGGRVFSHYGHGELALLGAWCEDSRSYHFLPNYGYLELLDEDGRPITEPGVVGEMVGTGFLNPIMPMIRYRTADYGVWDEPGPCPSCGRAHQRLATIEGRIQEYLVLKDGTRFPATNINAIHSLFFSHIYRFQFVQKEPGRAVLRFVPARPLTEAAMAEIRQGFEFFEPMGLALEYEAVPEIPHTPRGKSRIVLQEEEGEVATSNADGR